MLQNAGSSAGTLPAILVVSARSGHPGANQLSAFVNGAYAREVQQREAAGARSHAEFGDLILSARTKERVYINGDVKLSCLRGSK